MKYDITKQVIAHFLKELKYDILLVKDGFNEEAIHQFRVDVKKLRAFLRLLKQSEGKKNKLKFPQRIKMVFLKTGDIRDRQLYIKRLEQYGKGAGIRKKIKAMKNEIDHLKTEVDFPGQAAYCQIRRKLTRASTPAVNETDVKRFIRKKLRKIRRVSGQDEFTDVQLHSVRKWLKDINYVLAILKHREFKTHSVKFVDKRKIEEAQKLSQSLGSFNDIHNAILLLRNDGESVMLRKKWQAEKNSLKRTILNSLQAIQL